MFLLCLLALVSGLATGRPSSINEDITVDALDLGLASLIEAPLIHHDELFSHAIRIIHNYERAPSCHRVATKALIDSCRSLEPVERTANHALEHVKSAFAARLAICELHSAGAVIPSECLPMMPRSYEDQNLLCRSTGYHCDTHETGAAGHFKPTTQQQDSDCLRALESRPQWWTSYSNARQNAVLMCHAAREQIEQDQVLDTHRAMTTNAEQLSAALSRSTTEAASYLKQQKAFADAIKDFQAQLVKDLEQERRETRSIFSSLVNEVQAEYHRVFDKMFDSANDIAQKVDKINHDLSRTSEETKHAREDLNELFKDVKSKHVNLARASWESTQGLSVDVEHSLMRNKLAMDEIMSAMLSFRSDMNNIYEVMSLMHDHQTALRDRAESLTVAFGEVQAQVLELKSGMLEFANTQNDTMSSFKVEMETARALATAFGESVSSLNIVRVFSILDSFWFVLQGLGLFAVMVVVNWLAGKTAARVVAVTCLGIIIIDLVSKQDVGPILEASITALPPHGSPYSLILLAAFCICGITQFCRRIISSTQHKRVATTLRLSIHEKQHRPRVGNGNNERDAPDIEA